jgi:hypothetical protein
MGPTMNRSINITKENITNTLPRSMIFNNKGNPKIYPLKAGSYEGSRHKSLANQ